MSAGNVTERDVERVFVEEGGRLGAMVLKFSSANLSGVPDRIVLFPDGTHAFVELKAPGKDVRPLQERVFARLARLGHPVRVIDTKAGAHEFWRLNRFSCSVRLRDAKAGRR